MIQGDLSKLVITCSICDSKTACDHIPQRVRDVLEGDYQKAVRGGAMRDFGLGFSMEARSSLPEGFVTETGPLLDTLSNVTEWKKIPTLFGDDDV